LEFEKEKIKISVVNYQKVGFDAIIGFFNLDIALIYQAKDHAI